MFWKKWIQKKEIKKSHFESIAETFNQIPLDRLESVFSSDKSILKLSVLIKQIDEYRKFLERLINNIQSDTQIRQSELNYEVHVIYMRNFFIDLHYCFMEPKYEFERFLETVMRFLTLYEEKEKSLNKTFTLEKNLFLTQHIVSNLDTISKELSDGL